MRGRILSRQKCPVCGRNGEFEKHSYGLICQCGQFPATKPEIELYWQGPRIRITHDQNGRRFQSYEHAKRALGLIRNQVEQKTFYPELWRSKSRNELLWTNYVSAYLTQIKPHTSPSSYTNKRWALRHLDPHFVHLNVRDIRAAHVEDAATQLAQTELSVGSQREILTVLRTLLNRAYRREDIDRPVRVSLPSPPRHRIQYLTPDQQDRALEHIPPEHRPIFQFLFQYGTRVGEACGLCWNAIDLTREEFWLIRTFSNKRWLEATKTRRDRPLPILGWFTEYLDFIPRGFPSLPVFVNPYARTRERNYQGEYLRRIWAKAVKGAGLEPIPLKNATRHSMGFALRDKGADMNAIARVLGHTDTKTTRAYVEDSTAAVAKLLADQKQTKIKMEPESI